MPCQPKIVISNKRKHLLGTKIEWFWDHLDFQVIVDWQVQKHNVVRMFEIYRVKRTTRRPMCTSKLNLQGFCTSIHSICLRNLNGCLPLHVRHNCMANLIHYDSVIYFVKMKSEFPHTRQGHSMMVSQMQCIVCIGQGYWWI